MAKKALRKAKIQPLQRINAVNDRTYAATAQEFLGDLTKLLGNLGISAQFQVSGVKDNALSVTSQGNAQPYVFEIGEVLSTWHREPEYLDELGNPRELSRHGKGATFASLVSCAAPGLAASKILAALTRVNAVNISSNGKICVIRRSVSAFRDRDFAIHHTFIALRAFIRTLQHNLDSSPSNVDQLFHRIAWSGEFDRKGDYSPKNLGVETWGKLFRID